jgi:hypothetical protein
MCGIIAPHDRDSHAVTDASLMQHLDKFFIVLIQMQTMSLFGLAEQ